MTEEYKRTYKRPTQGNKLTNLKGAMVGDLQVLFKVNSKAKRPKWRCLCTACGARCTVSHVRLINKKTPKTHCGCKRKGLPTLHKREYHAWSDAKHRCHTPHHPTYPSYGAKGIVMCEEWRNSFKEFLEHIGLRPSNDYSLDRIDAHGHYEPGNVRWATVKQQARNKKTTKFIAHPKTGEKVKAAACAEEHEMTYQNFRQWMLKIDNWGDYR